MLAYYGSRISDHMTETPEGFLICHNVPIARTGKQDYLPEEIGQTGDRMVSVSRDEDEVFSKQTLASFEGKPVTDDHPPGVVSSDNFHMYAKGHCQNVHRGSGEDSDLIFADLFINDQELIRQIKNGKREVSCGYECDYVPDEKGNVHQRRIRGNHVAVVAAGRAGSRVSIKDSMSELYERMSNKKMSKKASTLARFFSGWVQDRDPEEVANAIDELMENEENEEANDAFPPAPGAAPAQKPPFMGKKPEEKVTDGNEEVVSLLRKVITLLGGTGDEDPNKDPIDAVCDELAEEDPAAAAKANAVVPPQEDQEESQTIPAEEFGKDAELTPEEIGKNPIPGADSAATIAALRAIKPYIARLPERERRAASDAAAQAVRKARGMDSKPYVNGYANILNARRGAFKRTASDNATEDIGRKIMEKFNPHYKNNK